GSALAALPDPVVSIDPRPAPGSPLLTTNRTAPSDGFFEPVSYRGAFGSTNWSTSWTNFGRLGYVTGCSATSSVVPDEVQGVAAAGAGSYVWSRPTLPGLTGVQFFDVLRSTSSATFSSATCLDPDGTDTEMTDAGNPAVGQTYYYVIRAENGCGSGTLGFRSDGVERTGLSCSLP
ncbi:MAG TPA: hypothetical protein VGR67_00685, partial [Candidatus Polarisedimenticolia bacterium]|nr:hypothetical protein [Candidatus Polarisedimenticolia bacterium]